MQPAFLPYNYTQTMYQRLQNLSQGSKTVDEYTEEFYKYLTWVELAETDDQLVSRYIGGLRQNIQDSLNLFDPVNVSVAHQRALLLKKTAARGSTGFFGRGIGGQHDSLQRAVHTSKHHPIINTKQGSNYNKPT
jgi:hypothetical protein